MVSVHHTITTRLDTPDDAYFTDAAIENLVGQRPKISSRAYDWTSIVATGEITAARRHSGGGVEVTLDVHAVNPAAADLLTNLLRPTAGVAYSIDRGGPVGNLSLVDRFRLFEITPSAARPAAAPARPHERAAERVIGLAFDAAARVGLPVTARVLSLYDAALRRVRW